MADATQKEFKDWLKRLNKVSKDSSLTKEKKRAIFRKELDGLSEEAFIVNYPKIIDIIQKSKDKCASFADSVEQFNDIIGWLPRLGGSGLSALLMWTIQERRKKYGLRV